MLIPTLIDELIERALREDLAGGDLTTEATVAQDTVAVGRAVARSALVACGSAVFARVFYALDASVRVEELIADGSPVRTGDVLWQVEGSARCILMAERTALNFVQRMSGIATLCRAFVDALPAGSRTRIADTRKTTPGLRHLERYAVRTGGAYNHRDMLGSAVLIKDNHIEVAGGVAVSIERARERCPHTAKIEVEVETLEQLGEALDAGADIVMLDNFAPDQVRLAVERARGRALVEISGRVRLSNVAELAGYGVDVISIGALTHSPPAADIALDIARIGT
jgi:nicotinate-nucleotide pyrophosphorylase (carboxylating)